jgi:predicted house-cleaning noncanonical NTP pyrophosphatase (MazG superfamily)
MSEYNKLVRDRIPEIIERDGNVCEFRTLNEGEFIEQLHQKLDEEVAEYQLSRDFHELADVLEVVYSIVDLKGASLAELERLRTTKRVERGGFEERMFLIAVSESQ